MIWDISVHSKDNRNSFLWQAGALELHVENRDGILEVSSRQDNMRNAEPVIQEEASPPPGEWDFIRFAPSESSEISILPLLPELPLVLLPDVPFTLLPGALASVFIHVPLYAALEEKGSGIKRPGRIIKEYPGTVLSKTWFGTPTAGELCFGYSCTFFPSSENPPPLHATLPLKLKNGADTPLPVEKVCLHTEFLELFVTEKAVWSNSIDVQYKGGDQGSSIKIGTGPPEECPKFNLTVSPRNTNKKNFVQKTFEVIRWVAGV